MTDQQPTGVSEERSGHAPPALDLIAAVCLVALSVWVMLEAARMEVPGTLATAPGLLPFLTAASLCVMAIALALLALRRAGGAQITDATQDSSEVRRALILFATVGCYILALEVLSFEYALMVAGERVVISSFEVISIVVLTTLLAMFWRRPLATCATVALAWILALSAVFRYVFKLPLPG